MLWPHRLVRPTLGCTGLGSRGEATHQVNAVGVHAAQGPPALVRVVVLGVGLYTTGVIAGGTADKQNSGSVWPLVGRKQAECNIANYGRPSISSGCMF